MEQTDSEFVESFTFATSSSSKQAEAEEDEAEEDAQPSSKKSRILKMGEPAVVQSMQGTYHMWSGDVVFPK